MAKKNKSKSSKNGTATAPTEARQSGQGRSTIIAAAAIAALAAVAAVVMSRDPAAAHGQAALRCYASDACAARDLPACGVVTAPSKIAAALRRAVDAKTVAVSASGVARLHRGAKRSFGAAVRARVAFRAAAAVLRRSTRGAVLALGRFVVVCRAGGARRACNRAFFGRAV